MSVLGHLRGSLLALAVVLFAITACAGPGVARQTAVAGAVKTSTPGGAAAAPVVPLDRGDRARGEQLFRSGQCLGCHSLGGSGGVIGPDLSEVGKRAPERAAAQRLEDPRLYLIESIVEPGAYVVDGYQPVMPDWRAQGLREQDLADLAAFLNSLAGP